MEATRIARIHKLHFWSFSSVKRSIRTHKRGNVPASVPCCCTTDASAWIAQNSVDYAFIIARRAQFEKLSNRLVFSPILPVPYTINISYFLSVNIFTLCCCIIARIHVGKDIAFGKRMTKFVIPESIELIVQL
jgi:hypothetical protein